MQCEPGIAGVTLTITGTSASGAALNQTAATAADGSYTFTGLRNANGSGYTMTETQPGSYIDGKVTAGTINGAACGTCNAATANIIGSHPARRIQDLRRLQLW